jgi:hypothetical protein
MREKTLHIPLLTMEQVYLLVEDDAHTQCVAVSYSCGNKSKKKTSVLLRVLHDDLLLPPVAPHAMAAI